MEEQKSKSDCSYNSEKPHIAKSELTSLIKKIVDKISDSDLQIIFQLVDEDLVIENKENIITDFRSGLFKSILNDFEANWNDLDVDIKLHILDVLKEHAIKKNKAEQWRPTGKTVQEQVLPYSLSLLKKKIAILETKSECLNKELELTIQKVVMNRERFSFVEHARNHLSINIDKRIDRFDKTNDKITELQKKANTILSKH